MQVDDSGKLILFWRCGSDDSVLNDIVEYETAKVIEQEMEKVSASVVSVVCVIKIYYDTVP